MIFIIVRYHEETLKLSTLTSKKRLDFNNLYILHHMSEEKTKKSESVAWGKNQSRAAVLVFINVQQYPISRKKYP